MSVVRRLLASQLAVLALILGGATLVDPSPAATGPCTAAQTRTVVFAFARAWSRGDVVSVRRLVAPEPQFKWVSAGRPGVRSGARAFARGSLGSYIAARSTRHDRLDITRFRFNGSDVRADGGYGHFEFDAARTSDDWPTGLEHLRPGKGAIVCTLSRPMLAVWSLG
jgi:hypothetical protein